MINLEELQAIKNHLTLKINLENFVNANLFKILLKKTNANVMISWKKWTCLIKKIMLKWLSEIFWFLLLKTNNIHQWKQKSKRLLILSHAKIEIPNKDWRNFLIGCVDFKMENG